MSADVDRLVFFRLEPAPAGVPVGVQVWEAKDTTGHTVARAEIFEGEVQWGVRLQDQAPELDERELLKVVARLLVWHVKCPADTIDVVLGRNHAHHTLVKVGADYV